MIAEQIEFLVKIDEDYFLVDVDGKNLGCTAIPSQAWRADYRTADKVCAGIRRRGHHSACVTTLTGQPVTTAILLGEQPGVSEPSALPKNLSDLHKISAAETKRRYKSEPAFAKRYDQIQATVGR